MKQFLTLALICFMTSAASATTTLHVWLVTSHATDNIWNVEVWVQATGLQAGEGIADMAVTISTSGSIGDYQPVLAPGNKVETVWGNVYTGDQVPLWKISAARGDVDGDGDMDANQMVFGAPSYDEVNGYPIGNTPTLIGTQLWQKVNLLADDGWLEVSIKDTSRYFKDPVYNAQTGTWDATKAYFDAYEGTGAFIPEPITMTMLGMGLSGLGMAVWRRNKKQIQD